MIEHILEGVKKSSLKENQVQVGLILQISDFKPSGAKKKSRRESIAKTKKLLSAFAKTQNRTISQKVTKKERKKSNG